MSRNKSKLKKIFPIWDAVTWAGFFNHLLKACLYHRVTESVISIMSYGVQLFTSGWHISSSLAFTAWLYLMACLKWQNNLLFPPLARTVFLHILQSFIGVPPFSSLD